MYYIIVFGNFRFRPSKRKRVASVFKKLHSRAFLVTAFTGYVWREAKLEKKTAVFEKNTKQNKTKKQGYVLTRP